MRCHSCNSVVEENWKFCASCGASIIDNSDRMAKMIEASVASALQGTGMSGFAIRAVPQAGNQNAPGEHKPRFRRQAQANFLEQPNTAKTVIEPKTDITRMPGKILIEAELRNVASGNDIKIMLLSESIEIRAVAPENMYMKILRVPKNLKLARSSFAGGKLEIELSELARNRF